jgi:hypothetical protein
VREGGGRGESENERVRAAVKGGSLLISVASLDVKANRGTTTSQCLYVLRVPGMLSWASQVARGRLRCLGPGEILRGRLRSVESQTLGLSAHH